MKAGSVKGLAAQHHGIREPQRPMVKRSLLLSAHSACGSSTSQPSRGGASYLLWRHAGVLGSPSSVSKPSCRSRGLAPPLASTPEDHLPASPDSNEHPLYEKALSLARASKFQEARQLFEALLTEQPHLCKAWVSYAQMEKRSRRIRSHSQWWESSRRVLQRGLTLNPSSSCLIQAWGLLELQRGNFPAACKMLDRCVELDPSNSPVLKWQPVMVARSHVVSKLKLTQAPAAAQGPPARMLRSWEEC